jgi:hypothetical protein
MSSGRQKHSQRAQAAPEFLLFISFFILLFIILSALFYRQQSDELTQKESLIARELVQQYADAANFALRTGDTFTGRFNFPSEILGRSYNLTFANGSSGYVYVFWQSEDGGYSSYSSPLSTGSIQLDTPNCIGCFGQDIDGIPGGPQLLTINVTGNMTFINKNGVLYLGNK